ncbi:MAG: T9SS type A sorting domain-containing protein [Ignavibacteria bacterium]|nr:T9SS type A sorting domain-containing protein [Ignavibacteria bacterium]
MLPVELAAFTSSVNDNNVTLLWQTSREINNSGFDIERSGLENNWSKAGFVKCTVNSDEPKYYSFIDKNLTTGKYKYRLKQIDFNGSFEYFDLAGEIVIGIPEKYELSQNYPNPFNPVTVIRYALTENGFTNLKIYDITGREVAKLVNEKQDAGRYEVTFNGSNFASGVYFYELRSGEFVSQKRMFLLK